MLDWKESGCGWREWGDEKGKRRFVAVGGVKGREAKRKTRQTKKE
jgi:hypothetical protein